MAFSLSIPLSQASEPLKLTVNIGEMLFILGANGTGKSSLMQAFASASQGKTRRISGTDRLGFVRGHPSSQATSVPITSRISCILTDRIMHGGWTIMRSNALRWLSTTS